MSESAFAPFLNYFRTLRELLTHPTQYFRSERTLRLEEDPKAPGLTGALAFALVTHWISESINYLWRQSFGRLLLQKSEDFLKLFNEVSTIDGHPGRHEELKHFGEQFAHWFWGVGAVLVDPFVSLSKILFFSLLIFIGARIFISPKLGEFPAVTFERVVRICCFGMAASILGVFPIVGTLVSPLAEVILLTIGIREVFGTSHGRALIVTLFPQLLLLSILFAGILAIFLFFAKILAGLAF